MRPKTVRRLLWLLCFGCLWLPVLEPPPLRSGAYVQDVRADAAVVALITAQPVRVRCEAVAGDGRRIPAQPAGSQDPVERRRRHAFQLRELRPGETCHYLLRDDAGRLLDQGSFRTPPANDRDPVRFAFVGDSGQQPWWVWLQRAPLFHLPACWEWLPVADSVAAISAKVAAAEPQFLLHLGDLIYPSGQHQHYGPGFFRPFADVLRRVPCYPVPGNHDVMDADGVQLLQNFILPEGSGGGGERCYSFAWGSLRVIVVDWNQELVPEHPSLDFLRRELSRCAEPWVVVASHFPMRSASRQRDRADLLLHGLPVLQQFGVDLYLSGHDHTYQRFGRGSGPDDVPLIVSGGGGKDLYTVRPDPRVDVVQSRFHWCTVEVHGRSLVLRARDLADGVLDTLRLDRGSEAHLSRIRQVNPTRAARIAALLAE